MAQPVHIRLYLDCCDHINMTHKEETEINSRCKDESDQKLDGENWMLKGLAVWLIVLIISIVIGVNL